MKKALLLLLLSIVHGAQCVDPVKTKKHALGNALCAAFLLVGGSWLAQKQIPRIAGQKIEFNAPIFTKVLASIFFTVGVAGVVGGVAGAYLLFTQMRDTQNEAKKCREL